MYKLLLSLVFAVFTFSISAQEWFLYKEHPVNLIPKFVDFKDDGTLIMVTSDDKYYYKPLNQDWTEMNAPYTGGTLALMVEKNSNRIYVGTSNMGYAFSDNMGQSWQHRFWSTSNHTGMHEGYYGFEATGDSNLFFGSQSTSIIYRFTNQGSTRVVLNLEPTQNLNPNVMTLLYDSNQTLLTGTYQHGIWFSENNGNTFTHSNLNDVEIKDMTEGANGQIYAVGKNLYTNEPMLWVSDNYLDWTALSVPNTTDVFKTLFYKKFHKNCG